MMINPINSKVFLDFLRPNSDITASSPHSIDVALLQEILLKLDSHQTISPNKQSHLDST
jgi:hypothetical protein